MILILKTTRETILQTYTCSLVIELGTTGRGITRSSPWSKNIFGEGSKNQPPQTRNSIHDSDIISFHKTTLQA